MRNVGTRRPVRDPVPPNYRMRRRVLLFGLSLGLLALTASALMRQVVETDYLQDQGELRYLRKLSIPVHRGEILDRHGEPLALSAPVVNVWADPWRLAPYVEVLDALAGAVEMETGELRRLLARNGDRAFVYLKRGVDPQVGSSLLELMTEHQAEGVGLERGYRRFYPNGEVTAHLVGLTDIDEKGLEGLEVTYDQWLRGSPGLRRVIQDGRGNIVKEVEGLRAPEPGNTLTLSLDRRLQFLAYRELKRAVRDNEARGGSAVILDPGSGEVLAMVNQPSYNPNDRSSIRPAALRNRSVTDVFEPGSTMKPLAIAAVLEAGKAAPETPVDTSPGYLPVGRHLVRDHRNYGLLTVTSVLTKSSNVGVTKLTLELQPEELWRGFQRLGLGQRTGSQFRGEVAGQLPYFDGWSRFEQATHSFGYGLSVTVLQLARAYCALAADGVLRPVALLKLERVPEGERVMRAATARAVRRMMETVVSAEGTAPQAAVEGYRVAGKTGTVKKTEAGGYSKDRYQAVFAGMIPASRPRLVMAVMIDEPRGEAYYGGLVAAPVFSRVMTGAMRLLNVAPDGLQPPGSRSDLRVARAEAAR
jgi:cell division protein FtsI (penicillin-binding protein 3)